MLRSTGIYRYTERKEDGTRKDLRTHPGISNSGPLAEKAVHELTVPILASKTDCHLPWECLTSLYVILLF